MLGLDIGTKTIKAVQLDPQGDKFTLVAAGITSTPLGGVSGTDQQVATTAEAIKKLITDTKITHKEVNISLPESQVFTRLIELPSLTDQEVSSAISWQAESYIPIPIDEANIDYQIVERRNPERVPQGVGQGAVDVLLIAAPKILVEKYVRIVDLAGLTVASVETEMIALSRALAPAERTVLIVDLGGSYSNFAIVKNGRLMLSRSISTGGDALSRTLSKNLGITLAQAEEYKKAYGLHRKQLEGKIRSVLELPLKIIVDEIKKAIQYYRSELKREEQVTEVILNGGVAGTPELTPFLAEQLGIEIRVGDPFARVISNERLNKGFSAYAPLYGVVVGLAQKTQ